MTLGGARVTIVVTSRATGAASGTANPLSFDALASGMQRALSVAESFYDERDKVRQVVVHYDGTEKEESE